MRLVKLFSEVKLVTIGLGSNFILGGQTCRSCIGIPLGGSGGMPLPPPPLLPMTIRNFRHSETVSRAILQELQQSPVRCCSWGTKVVAQLSLEGSPVLDSTDVPSSGPKQSMPEVHGLVGSSTLESTGALLFAPTQPILEVLFTKRLARTFV